MDKWNITNSNDTNSESPDNVNQLSFQLDNFQFEDNSDTNLSSSSYNLDQALDVQNQYWLNQYAAQDQVHQEPKFFFYSSLLHAALALVSLFIKIPEYIKPEVETIVVELQEQTPEEQKRLMQINRGEDVTATKGLGQVKPSSVSAATTQIQNPKSGALNDEKIVIAARTSPKSKAPIAKVKTKSGGGVAKVARSAPSRAGVPDSLEDIAAPKLDFDGVDVSQTGSLGDNEFEDDFRNIDKSHAAALVGAKNQFDQELKQIADDSDAALQAAEIEQQEKVRAMQAAEESLRLKNAQAIANAQQAERAAIERAARVQALADQQEKAKQAALAAAAAAALKQNGSGIGNKEGRGFGNNGEDRASNKLAGVPNGVRSLDQLRQMPGNPKPQYSMDERRSGHQGNVVFYAYITKQGRPQNFKMVSSTGFRNLDSKTLASLKQWKFYPGQEGWVELPFEWNLKGGVQEMPTTLRRRAGGF